MLKRETKKSLRIPELLKNLNFIISLIWKIKPSFCLAKLLVIVVSTITPFVWIIFPKYIIDEIVSASGFEKVFKYILIMCGVLFLIGIINLYLDTYIGKYEGLIQFILLSIYNEKLMSLNYEDLESPHILDLF